MVSQNKSRYIFYNALESILKTSNKINEKQTVSVHALSGQSHVKRKRSFHQNIFNFLRLSLKYYLWQIQLQILYSNSILAPIIPWVDWIRPTPEELRIKLAYSASSLLSPATVLLYTITRFTV